MRSKAKSLCVLGLILVTVVGLVGCAEEGATYSQEMRSSTYQSNDGATYTAPAGKEKCTIDLDKLAKQSCDENKPIYLEFTADWCGYCKKYERDTINTAQGQEILKKAIFVQVNYDKNRSLARQYGFTGIPAGVLLKGDANGKLTTVDKHVGGLSLTELDAFLCKGL
jgi:thiol:disulfide interchange protein